MPLAAACSHGRNVGRFAGLPLAKQELCVNQSNLSLCMCAKCTPQKVVFW